MCTPRACAVCVRCVRVRCLTRINELSHSVSDEHILNLAKPRWQGTCSPSSSFRSAAAASPWACGAGNLSTEINGLHPISITWRAVRFILDAVLP